MNFQWALLFTILCGISSFAKPSPVFRFHLFSEPTSLNPQLQRNSSSNYVLGNLFRNFYSYNDDKGLLPDLGEKCERPHPLKIKCTLRSNLKWSDGTTLTATDFVESYQRFLSPALKAPRADLLFKVKNAKTIFERKMPATSLGIRAVNSRVFEIELETQDLDFEYNLANTILAPVKTSDSIQSIFNGPYKLKKWTAGQSLLLEPNPQYQLGSPQRPEVQVSFIEEDTVALRLYEKGELDFLRRLPSLYIPKWKTKADFFWIPVIRFDYFGFGPELTAHPKLRQALGLSLDYPELQKIFSAEGVPGCAGIPRSWVPQVPCLTQNNEVAKRLIQEDKPKGALDLQFSDQGGDDHKRVAEWLLAQWKTNINVMIRPQSVENKIYTSRLKESPPAIFRRGVSPDRPTCLSILETFAATSPDNFIQLKSSRYDQWISQLATSRSQSEKRKICQVAIQFLLDEAYLIPTGPIHFAVLSNSQFKGWTVNGLNQLDLANLQIKN